MAAANRATRRVVPKRVLFVDDERALLDGLRGRLRNLRTHWEMVFVESGARAITELEQRAFDVIVSDMRMPGMDGAQLLATVSERWPETARIIFSGYSDEEYAGRLLTVAHQYLSKPCEAQQIENAIERCVRLHELLVEPRLRATVGRIRQLPTMPQTSARLHHAMASGNVSVKEIAAVIGEDPAIAARVLQLVNSSFFGLGRRITKIDQAVTHLGFICIRNVAMSAEIFSNWQQFAGSSQAIPQRLMLQSQKTAAVARALTQGTPLADDAMLAGLLHCLGYWVLMQECPGEIEEARRIAEERSITMHEAEREVLGASHAEIGAYLLGIWGLPYPIIEAVAFQHTPQLVRQTEFDLLAALVVAETVVLAGTTNAFGVCEGVEIPIDDEYLRSVNSPFDWNEVQRRAASIDGASQDE